MSVEEAVAEPVAVAVAEPKSINLSMGIGHFTPKGEQLASKWKRWKRAFRLYLEARGVTKPEQKLALLLHSGGLEFQDLYFTLVPEETVKTYEESITILDGYFIPKANVPFERHQFRQLEQGKGETVNQFVCRLRQKALSCDFTDADENIRDQVIDKVNDAVLRRKFLEKSNASLSDLQDIAQAYEAVEDQLKTMTTVDCNWVNKNNDKHTKDKATKSAQMKKKEFTGKCYRCDGVGHYARDPKCPAKSAVCSKCKKVGHYASKCKSRIYHVDSDSNCSKGEEHAFSVFNSISNINEGMVKITVGGVDLNVLIDSGASCNVIDEDTWGILKQKGISCVSKKGTNSLFAYGYNKIETLGEIKCEIGYKGTKQTCTDKFVVIKGRGKPILGKRTSENLNLLRVGPPLPTAYSVTPENAGNDTDIRTKFSDIFEGVGKLINYKVKLHIDKTVPPVAQPVRRVPFGLREKVEKHLYDLEKKGIIEPVVGRPTEWVSPLVVVPKSGGDVRVCVDMRRANEAILRERHPIPTVDEVIHDMNGATFFSKLDLKWGFHQVELDEDSRDITTFCSHIGLYRYCRLMFGVNAAPEKYHKVIEDLFKGCLGVANIADDLIVYGRNVNEHDERLFKVLEILREHGLTVNGKKCQFRMSKLTFFGHDLSPKGVSPSEEKVDAIREASAPKNVSEVRSFLGLVQYSAKFLPDLAEVSEPLRKLTRKGESFHWGRTQNESFSELKRMIASAETLAYFREDSKTRVIADAGPNGIGAVLVQLHGENWRIISYASRNLSQVERRYSQTEKEALALVWACERFNLYLFGREFELETDHKPLECIYGKKSKPSARIERWVLRLQGYKYKVVYRPGKTNIADALSRLNCPKSKDVSAETEDFVRVIAEEATPIALSPQEVELESGNDTELSVIREFIQTGNWDKCKLPNYVAVKNELCVLGKLVLRGTRIVIPQSLRHRVIELAHEGHQGIVKTKDRLRTKVWWPNMDRETEKYCKVCHGCQVVGIFSKCEPMQRTRPPEGPWQDLAIDLMGPLPSGDSILVVVDYFSRYYEVVIMGSTTTSKIIRALMPMFARWGIPFSIKSDNGPQFISDEFENYLRQNGIEHRKSPPLWPQANGEVERQNRSLLKCLKICKTEGKDMREELTKFLLAYRSTPHSVTGATPAKLMMNRELRTKLPELRESGGLENESVRDQDWKTKLLGKQYSDLKRGAVENNLKLGDSVLLKNVKSGGKLATNFENEPYTVTKKEGHEVTVESKDGVQYNRDSSHVKVYNELEKHSEPDMITPQDSVKVASPIPLRRTSRNIQPPKKLDDYIVKY